MTKLSHCFWYYLSPSFLNRSFNLIIKPLTFLRGFFYNSCNFPFIFSITSSNLPSTILHQTNTTIICDWSCLSPFEKSPEVYSPWGAPQRSWWGSCWSSSPHPSWNLWPGSTRGAWSDGFPCTSNPQTKYRPQIPLLSHAKCPLKIWQKSPPKNTQSQIFIEPLSRTYPKPSSAAGYTPWGRLP